MSETANIHVYDIPLSAEDARYRRARSALNPNEKERAARFRFEEHRRNWVLSRAALRHILGQHLNCHATRVQLGDRSDGKPVVIAPDDTHRTHTDQKALPHSQPAPLYFNLSHSHQRALVAVSDRYEVGCDVEWVKPIREVEGVSKRFFSFAEQRALNELANKDRLQGFYRCWTRKEAVIKATGEGLRAQLDAFDVDLNADAEPGLLAYRHSRYQNLRWHLYHLAPAEHYVAAVAVAASERPVFKQVVYDYPE